jgi:hypothetical protein
VRRALQFEEHYTGEIEPRLGSIGVPVLVVWGEEDGWLDPWQASRLQQEVPGSQLRLIPRAGHFVQEDAPEEGAEVLVGFFYGVRSRRRESSRVLARCMVSWTSQNPVRAKFAEYPFHALRCLA